MLWSNVNPGFITPWAVKLRGYWDIILTTYHFCLRPRPNSSARVYCSKVDIMIHYHSIHSYSHTTNSRFVKARTHEDGQRLPWLDSWWCHQIFFCWTRSFKVKVERICCWSVLLSHLYSGGEDVSSCDTLWHLLVSIFWLSKLDSNRNTRIEWGVLLRPDKQGSPRYASRELLGRLGRLARGGMLGFGDTNLLISLIISTACASKRLFERPLWIIVNHCESLRCLIIFHHFSSLRSLRFALPFCWEVKILIFQDHCAWLHTFVGRTASGERHGTSALDKSMFCNLAFESFFHLENRSD